MACPHTAVTVRDQSITCDSCSLSNIPLTIDQEGLKTLFGYLHGIIWTLEKAGMVDTAMEVRIQARQLLIDRQITWEG